MKKLNLKTLAIIGAVFGSLAGSLDHFLYDWTKLTWVGIFSPINESSWEHLKLLFFPVVIFAVLEWFYVKDKRSLLFAKTAQIVLGALFIISFFYTYTGALGIENVWIDIASFLLAMVLGYALSYKIIQSVYKPYLPAWFWALVLFAIFAKFQYMNWSPYHIPLFMDKPTGTYGINHNI